MKFMSFHFSISLGLNEYFFDNFLLFICLSCGLRLILPQALHLASFRQNASRLPLVFQNIGLTSQPSGNQQPTRLKMALNITHLHTKSSKECNPIYLYDKATLKYRQDQANNGNTLTSAKFRK